MQIDVKMRMRYTLIIEQSIAQLQDQGGFMESYNNNAHRKITIDKIAQNLGYSKTTISRAISGKGRISQDTRKKVLQYCEECGYKPNIIARGLAKSKTYNIAAVLPADPELNEIPFFQNCLLGICEMASSIGYDIIVVTMEAGNISRIRNVVENHKVDAVILLRTLVQDVAVDYLQKIGFPFTVIGNSKNLDVPQIDNHHVEACRELTSLLVAKKMRRMAFIGGNLEHVVNQKRFQGFQEGLTLNQIKLNWDLIYLNCTTKAMVYTAVEKIVENNAECIICMDDKICSQVLVKLNDMRVMIPRDLKIASFYDSLFLQSYHPSITTLKFDEKELGRMACKMTLDRLNGEDVAQKLYLGYDVVLRSSTK